MIMDGSCPYCNMTQGEEKIFQFLQKNNITFKFQAPEKINNQYFYFDFKLMNNFYIEFNGEQHFRNTKYSFADTNKRDKIKNNFISLNNFKILRISYNQIKNIYNILTDILLNKTFRDYPLGEYENIFGNGAIHHNEFIFIG